MAETAKSQEQNARHAFDRLIATYAECTNPLEQAKIRDTIWERYGACGATFISDMASFSSTSRMLGVCHFLKLIHRARQVIAPIVTDNNGLFLKCEADNCYAFFASADDAIRASFDMNAEMFRVNQKHDLADHVHLSVGIDYGDLLLIGSEDFYGDPVNTASKLGEDLAVKDEILVTERAIAESAYVPPDNAERMVARISEIEISYLRLPMKRAEARAQTAG